MDSLADQKSRDRIERELTTGMAVSAAAGTGKTREMVERMVGLVRAETPVTRIAAITFTEKAAAELELRVRTRLEGLLHEPDAEATNRLDPETRRRLTAALSDLDRASISTIHAFALAMIKERPMEAGVDPQVQIMDEIEQQLFFEQSFSRWLHGLSAEDRETVRRLGRFGLAWSEQRELARQLAQNRDVAEIIGARPPSADDLFAGIEKSISALAQSAREIKRECETQCKNFNDPGWEAVGAWESRISEVEKTKDPERRRIGFMQIEETAVKYSAGQKGNWKSGDFHAERKERMKSDRERMVALQEQVRSAVITEALHLLLAFVEYDWKARSAEGRINFQDVLILARDLLKRPGPRSDFRARWDHLLVDEFQDTDPLQVEIVSALFEGREQGLFLVGDPKQSIYRFRRADVAVYQRTVEKLCAKVGRPVEELTVNFRSRPEIINWVNREFSRLIVRQEKIQAEYRAMSPGRKAETLARGPLPPVSALLPPDPETVGPNLPEIRREEAERLAELIAHLVWSKRYEVYDPDLKAFAPISFRHIAVLYFLRPQDPARWLQPFLDLELPLVSDLHQNFYAKDEVSALLFCLRAIDDPGDALSLFGALRSFLFGFSDEELFLFTRAQGKLDYREPVPPGFPELGRAFEFLSELHKERNRRPARETLEQLFQGTGARISATGALKNDLSLVNLERVLGQARAFEAEPLSDFSRFISVLAAVADLELASPEPISLDPDEDFVRFSTVHAAKGLEFPVVILANFSAQMKTEAPGLLADRAGEGTAAAKIGDFRSPGYERMAEEEKLHLQEQAKRLFYVAATRARDALIVSAFFPPEKNAEKRFVSLLPPDFLLHDPDRFGTERDQVFYWDPKILVSTTGPAKGRAKKKTAAGRPSLEEFMARRAQVLAAAGRDLRVIRGSQAKTESAGAGAGQAEKETGGRKLGLLVHELMEQIDLRGEPELERLCAARAKAAGAPESADEVYRHVKNCLASAPVKRAVVAGQMQREVPYCVWIGDEAHEGRLDLVFREGDKIVVVDYKTDRAPQAAGQLAEYRKAVSRAVGGEIEVWLVFSGPGEAVLVPP